MLKFKIVGVNAKIQNFPETFVATPSIATIHINGIKIIVILESVVICFMTSSLFKNPGAKK